MRKNAGIREDQGISKADFARLWTVSKSAPQAAHPDLLAAFLLSRETAVSVLVGVELLLQLGKLESARLSFSFGFCGCLEQALRLR